MDSRLLQQYENELSFLREMGGEFARSYPKIAGRLGMDGVEVFDPYVERLIEGVAFLTARVQFELDLQQPAFAAHLLEASYPHYLGPTPSMMIAELEPDPANGSLTTGFVLPRHTRMRSKIIDGTQTACTFLTAQDITMYPVEIAEAEYIDSRGELVAAGVAGGAETRAAIRLRIRRFGGAELDQIPLDRLTLYLGGEGLPGRRLHQALCADAIGIAARSTDQRKDWRLQLPQGAVRARGFDPAEALLPHPRQSFDGYRMLQEYFALPERLLFAELQGLLPAMSRSENDSVDLYIQLRQGDETLAGDVDVRAFRLNCTPAINLFEKRCDRVHVTTRDAELHLVPDRIAPMDYEVHTVLEVEGIGRDNQANNTFYPFYAVTDAVAAGGVAPAYYSARRRLRQRSEKERLRGSRTNYLGTEIYLSLVDRANAPFSADLSQLACRALVTNRDLPSLLQVGAPDLFHLPDGGPVRRIRLQVPPTRPKRPIAEGETAWRLISHLGLNYLSIADAETGSGAMALKELISLYSDRSDAAMRRQIEGITSVSTRPIVRRISDGVLSSAVRGLEISLTFDDDAYQGSGIFQLASVLERFFANYTSINSFTETVLSTQQSGTIARWQPRTGRGRII
ncbi:type VI secretion system baseplate subunit TssF [Pseudooceanicola sp. C21-150M6]|uniref:type VI secretion system baseplate subunit TssF n=1 Tax=Pseudooceanicola sp. C21-150M6 TaxID=3434355 RepID=UPI003D7FFF53